MTPSFHLSGPDSGAGWAEWGRTADHGGSVGVVAQRPARVLASFDFDPFVTEEQKEGVGDVLIHYQSPLVTDDDLFMEVKAGAYAACDTPGSGMPAGCGSAGWDRQVWTERRYSWEGGSLVEKWRFESDWKPEPDMGGLAGWEPVFHAALAGDFVLVPGAGGSIFVVQREDGKLLTRVSPFGDLDPDTYVAGPLTVAADGSVYYHAIKLNEASPWQSDVEGAWLVHISPEGTVDKARFVDLVAGAPEAMDACTGHFTGGELPWPPSPDAVPAPIPCGSLRPGLNIAPAVAPDGTIYTVARGHFASRSAFLVAVRPDLSPRWASSLANRLDDGCGSALMPPNGAPGGCRAGAKPGIDPATNELPAPSVSDLSTASPVVAPDGSVLYGAYTRYNHARGHLLEFSAAGSFLTSYDFGWDVTPAIYRHGDGYSVIIKDNHYEAGSYCADAVACPEDEDGPYHITQLGDDLVPQWRFSSGNQMSCTRGPDGTTTCTPDHPNGFEWCINAPAVDANGTVFSNGEDGVLYAIDQGGQIGGSLFLRESLGAAYTPLSLDGKGRIYALNYGTLYVVGE